MTPLMFPVNPVRPGGADMVVLVSGGIDSTICADMYPKARLLFVDFGQRECEHEYKVCQRLFGDRLERAVIRADLRYSEDGIVIPARNLLLASLAANYGSSIVIAGLLDDHVPDKNAEAFDAMSDVLSRCAGYAVSVFSPLIRMHKHEAVNYYLRVDPEHRDIRAQRLASTWSCYTPTTEGSFHGEGEQRCLDCPACFRWAVSLRVNGIRVAMPSDRVIESYLSRLHTYEPGRRWATLQALRMYGDGRRVMAVDIDGVVTVEPDGREYATRTPASEAIAVLRDAFASNHSWVVLHTARDESDRTVTVEWLARHGVPHHALLMNKPPADIRVDDRTVAVTSLEEVEKP